MNKKVHLKIIGNVTKEELDRLVKSLKVDGFEFFIERSFIVV